MDDQKFFDMLNYKRELKRAADMGNATAKAELDEILYQENVKREADRLELEALKAQVAETDQQLRQAEKETFNAQVSAELRQRGYEAKLTKREALRRQAVEIDTQAAGAQLDGVEKWQALRQQGDNIKTELRRLDAEIQAIERGDDIKPQVGDSEALKAEYVTLTALTNSLNAGEALNARKRMAEIRQALSKQNIITMKMNLKG